MAPQTTARRGIPDATVARLPEYLRALTRLLEEHTPTVSSNDLAAAAGVSPAQLRKDLSFLGSHGVRGVGYDVARLAGEIASRLGAGNPCPVVVVGAGRLGQAIARYPGLTEGAFHLAALLDLDDALVGARVGPVNIRPASDLEAVVEEFAPVVGVIATPGEAAQGVCDRLVAAGVGSILTFAPGPLTAPEPVQLRRVDVATELQILAFHAQAARAAAAGSATLQGRPLEGVTS